MYDDGKGYFYVENRAQLFEEEKELVNDRREEVGDLATATEKINKLYRRVYSSCIYGGR